MTLPKRLLDGYASFRSGRYAEESERYAKLGTGAQKPSVMIIACCDSRAAPETIFDAGPGEIFVMRNVANLVPPYAPDGKHHSTSAAIEFAVLSLGHLSPAQQSAVAAQRELYQRAFDEAQAAADERFVNDWMI